MHCMKCINIFTFTPTSVKADPRWEPAKGLHAHWGDPQLNILSGEGDGYLGEILRGKAEELHRHGVYTDKQT